MGCDFVTDREGNVAVIACGRGRRRPKPCGVRVEGAPGGICGKEAPLLWDGPPPTNEEGWPLRTHCDRPICEAHARHVGHNRDLCPSCAKDYKPAPRRDPATMPKRLRREPA